MDSWHSLAPSVSPLIDRSFWAEAPNHFGEHSKTDIYLCIYGRKKVNNERTDRPVLPFWLSHSSHLSDNLLKGAQNNISQVITHFFTRISLDFCHNFCLTFALFFLSSLTGEGLVIRNLNLVFISDSFGQTVGSKWDRLWHRVLEKIIVLKI